MIKTMPRWSRVGAFIIDATTINAIVQLIISLIPTTFFELTLTDFSHDIMIYFVLLLLQVFIATCYATLFYTLAGATFGKFFLRQDIVSIDKNEKISGLEMFKREQLKWTLIYASFLIYPIYGAYCIINKKAMLHEKVSNTKII